MAFVLTTLLEKRVRKGTKAEDTPIMIPGKKKTMPPTARMILDMLDTVQVAHVEHEGIVPNLDRCWARFRFASTSQSCGLWH
jgi:hypothetical protein